MAIAQPVAGWLMCPEIVMEIWMVMAGKQASLKHLCHHSPRSQHRRRSAEEEIMQSRTILNSNSHFRHRTTRARDSVLAQGLTRVQQLATGVTQNSNNPKMPGLLKMMGGQKTMGGPTRKMGTNGRQMMGGIMIIANGVNNLTLRHGPTLYLRTPFIPKQRHMHRPVDGKAGARRREDYPR